jgi:alpha-glucosidase
VIVPGARVPLTAWVRGPVGILDEQRLNGAFVVRQGWEGERMDGRDLARTLRLMGSAGGRGAVRTTWRRYRTDARDLPARGAERARVPGAARGAEALPGGGVVRFARSRLRVRVAVGGAVFCGWDGAEPEPSYAVAGQCPAADTRAVLEPDKDGWRVVSERITVIVSRDGGVGFFTPGGQLLRRELPPRWWDAAAGPSRWEQRSRTPADAEVFGLGARASGPRLAEGTYRLWNTDHGRPFGPKDDPLHITMPVQMVVADSGCHLLFHDNAWNGRVTLREGSEGAGSGHDRLGGCRVRFDGGPLRYWVMAGTPERVLRTWVGLTGRPALPPRWALGHQHRASGDAREVLRVADSHRERGIGLSAVHLDAGHFERHRGFTADRSAYPDLPGLAERLGRHGTRLVSVVEPAVPVDPGSAVYDGGAALDAFVRDARGAAVRARTRAGVAVYPDFTHPRIREWWGGLYAERLERGFAGVWHDGDEPSTPVAFGDPTLPRSVRHALDGQGGDHREAHNVYALSMARAGFEGLSRLRPDARPLLLSRAGWAGMQRYGGTWSGEVLTGWPGLRASLALAMGLGLCGVPYSGTDVGGYGAAPSAELYVRWLQLAAFLPFFRTRSAGGSGSREPWEFGPAALECARAALARRDRLAPYLYTLAHLAHLTGAPYVRPLWWLDPEDRGLRRADDTFLLGDALLVAPVLEEGAVSRTVRLPRGRWYDTGSGAAYQGPGRAVLDAPLEHVPVLARAGAVIPVADADGGVELEVWAPAPGRTGRGLLITDDGDGWTRPALVRFTVRHRDGRVAVERDGGGEAGYRLVVRGSVP